MAERSAYRVSDLTLNGLTFDADFDSGNCARVAAIAGIPEGYDVWTAADCAGTPLVCAAKTWFHFSVRGGAPGSWITITVNNMNGQGRLYKHDYRPVFRSGASGGWQRTRTPVTARGCKADDNFRITFRHRFECAQGEPTFFAFSYPWSYAEGQALLAELEAAYGGAGPGGEGAAGSAGAELGAGGIYFRRELLATSIEGRRVDLLTITAARGGPGGEPEPPAGGRPAFVLSARVHPGETPASHVLNGFLAFALRRDDPRARALREAFVLKVVPCLNPDGVFHGHYRLDTRGVNLNRCYTRPDARLHPAIHAARALLCGLHERGALRFHVDLHAHASKRGCFFYGNALPDARQQAECVLYAKLAALNCQTLDFDGCVFATPAARRGGESEGEASKEGASRVAIYRQTGATHCYTLECNYNMGRLVNRLAEPLHGRPLSPLPIAPGCVAPKYTPETWAEVGRALALAALDLSGFNPRSRLALAGGGSLEAASTDEAKEIMAGVLFEMAHDASLPALIAEAGALPPLVALTQVGTDAAKEFAAGVLAAMNIDPALRSNVVEAGALPPLVALLQAGTDVAKEYASGVLAMCACSARLRAHVVETGALPPLVALLQLGNDNAKENSAIAFANLARDPHLRSDLISCVSKEELLRALGEGIAAVCVQKAAAESRVAAAEARERELQASIDARAQELRAWADSAGGADAAHCDVIFKCANGVELGASRFLLVQASSYYRKLFELFESGSAEAASGVVKADADFSSTVHCSLLRQLHSLGEAPLPEDGGAVLELLKLAFKLGPRAVQLEPRAVQLRPPSHAPTPALLLERVIDRCEQAVLDGLDMDNCLDVLAHVEAMSSFPRIVKAAQTLMAKVKLQDAEDDRMLAEAAGGMTTDDASQHD